MDLTTIDLGARTEEVVHRREYHMHKVVGLPDDVQAMIIEEHGDFRVYYTNLTVPTTARHHASMELALQELRDSLVLSDSR